MNRIANMLGIFLCLVIMGWAVSAFALEATGYGSSMGGLEPRNSYESIDHYLPLAENNDPHAQYVLGRMYATGGRVERDYQEAYVWLHLAEMNGVADAAELKRQVKEEMAAPAIAQAHRRIDYWRQRYLDRKGQVEILTKPTVRRVQRVLARQRLYSGSIDGLMGARTREAIRRYQQRNNRVVDGRVTPSLLRSMGLDDGMPSSSSLYETEVTADSGAAGELQAVKEELREIIRQARRDGAAPWLIGRLENLAAQESGEWSHQVLQHLFSAPEYGDGEGWQVVRGDFYPEHGRGLVVTGGSSWGTASDSSTDLAMTLLEILMNRDHANGKESVARMENDISFGDAFALRVETGSFDTTEGLVFSVDGDEEAGGGYTMVFHPGQAEKVKVFEVHGNNAREIISRANPVALDKRASHTITWTRSSSGEMAVSVDDTELLRVKTVADDRPFNTLGITHIGERIVFEALELLDRPQ